MEEAKSTGEGSFKLFYPKVSPIFYVAAVPALKAFSKNSSSAGTRFGQGQCRPVLAIQFAKGRWADRDMAEDSPAFQPLQ